MITRNVGKMFEDCWKASIPDDVLIQRMFDPVQSFLVGPNAKYSPRSPYDFFMYKHPNLFCLELKTKGVKNITFYREDFVKGKFKEDSFDIRKNQIEGLTKASRYRGVIAGFILNFRLSGKTYFLGIDDFNWLVEDLPKKSINEEDILAAGGFIIESKIARVRPHYNIEKFIEDAKEYLKHGSWRKKRRAIQSARAQKE